MILTCENVSWPAEVSQEITFQTLRVWIEVVALLATLLYRPPDQVARGILTSWNAVPKPAGAGGVLDLASSPQEHCLPRPCCLFPAANKLNLPDHRRASTRHYRC